MANAMNNSECRKHIGAMLKVAEDTKNISHDTRILSRSLYGVDSVEKDTNEANDNVNHDVRPATHDYAKKVSR